MIRDSKSNRVGVEEGIKLMVNRETLLSGRFTTVRDPNEELKSDDTTIPFAEMVTFTVALEEGSVVIPSAKAGGRLVNECDRV